MAMYWCPFYLRIIYKVVIFSIIHCDAQHIDIRIVLHMVFHLLQIIRFYPVITIHKHHIFTFGILQTHISGIGYATIGNMDNTDTLILPCIIIYDGRCRILAAVINDNQLPVAVALSDDAVNTSSYGITGVICRDNY